MKNKEQFQTCWGRNAVEDLIRHNPEVCEKILVVESTSDKSLKDLLKLADIKGIQVLRKDREELERISGGNNHQGVLAYFTLPDQITLDVVVSKLKKENDGSLLVILDHIKDPHNLGAVVRTAEVFGADGIIVPKDRSVSLTGTVVKVSSGAALRLPIIQVTNLARTIEFLKKEGYWVTGLDQKAGGTIWDAKWDKKSVIVMGSEGEGLSSLVRKKCDDLMGIPMKGSTGSLNVSVACAIGIYEWFRSFSHS